MTENLAPDVAAMVKRLDAKRAALATHPLNMMPMNVIEYDAIRAMIEKLGQCPRPQIMGEHACSNRTQCWEPCGDLSHHEEYTRPAPPPERP